MKTEVVKYPVKVKMIFKELIKRKEVKKEKKELKKEIIQMYAKAIEFVGSGKCSIYDLNFLREKG